MRLRPKFNLLLVLVFLSVSVASWVTVQRVSHSINQQWASLYARRQVQYDKQRILAPLLREIALAKQLALEPALSAAAGAVGDAGRMVEALRVLERYRENFRDQSYFFALTANGEYYYNNRNGDYTGAQLRYRLSPEKPDDAWFYATIASGQPYHVNLDPDYNLNVTKVWINVLVGPSDAPLGMVGTGIDISDFLADFISQGEPGVRNIFVDRDRAIQLYQDTKLIDYASITKTADERSRVDSLFDGPEDVSVVSAIMDRMLKQYGNAQSLETPVEIVWVSFEGQPHLLGISYLPEIDWFDLTLMDTRGLIDLRDVIVLPVFMVVLFMLAVGTFHLVLTRSLIQPMARLSAAVGQMGNQDFVLTDLPNHSSSDEMGEINEAVRTMAESLRRYTGDLESLVAERTRELSAATAELQEKNAALDRLSRTDALTRLHNRHHINESLDIEAGRSERSGEPCGLLLLDVDHFKSVNDDYGHDAGDAVLRMVAERLTAVTRGQDIVGRWGGEEFVVLLPATDATKAAIVAEKLRRDIESQTVVYEAQTIQITVSVGIAVFLPQAGGSIRDVVNQADFALYTAKETGRNRCEIYRKPRG